jgi:hypothetical protein
MQKLYSFSLVVVLPLLWSLLEEIWISTQIGLKIFSFSLLACN